MPKAFTLEEVRNWLDERNCKLLSSSYKNSTQKLEYECGNCGEIHLRNFNKMRVRGYCPKKLALSVEEITKRLLEKGKEYIGEIPHEPYRCRLFEYRCIKCGCVGAIGLSALKDSVHGCESCYHESKKKAFSKIREAFESLGLVLESQPSEYKDSKTKLKCTCKKCGYVGSTSYDNVYKGYLPCDCNKKIGENHHLYNPNITKEDRERKRQYTEYGEWRKKVFARDNYTCQCCGSKRHLNAHHLYNYGDFRDKRTEVNNGVTLCRDCHIGFHVAYGSRFNTPEQYYGYRQLRQYKISDIKVVV